MDVKSAFLNGDPHEEIYMEQPQRFIQDSTMVCRLKKSIYGLKKAPWAWYAKMNSFLLSVGLTRYVKNSLYDRLSMTDIGLLHYFLGIETHSLQQGSHFLSPSMLLTRFLYFT